MINQIVNFAIRIFSYTFSGCQTLFVFDNTANHICFMTNALLTKKINLHMGKKQAQIRDRFNNVI